MKSVKIATLATVVRLHAGHVRGENPPGSRYAVKELTYKCFETPVNCVGNVKREAPTGTLKDKIALKHLSTVWVLSGEMHLPIH